MSSPLNRISVLSQRLIAANDVVDIYRSRNLFMLQEIWALQHQFDEDRCGPDHEAQTSSRHWKWYAKRTLQFIDEDLRTSVTNGLIPLIFPVKLIVEPLLFRCFLDVPTDEETTSPLTEAIMKWFELDFTGFRHRIGMFLENETIWVALLTLHGKNSQLYIFDYRYHFRNPSEHMAESRMTYPQRLFNFVGGRTRGGLRTFIIADKRWSSNGTVPNSREQFQRANYFIKTAIVHLGELEAGEHRDFSMLCEMKGTDCWPSRAESL